jgi:hypothetical protein
MRIVGERLPGRTVGEHSNVHLGIQKGAEVVDLVPGDAPSARFDVMVVHRDDDFRSPYVHGKPGDRFLYLCWLDLDPDGGEPTRIGRITLMLSAIPPGLVRDDTGGLEAYLALTDQNGKLVMAAVRPPQVTWMSA